MAVVIIYSIPTGLVMDTNIIQVYTDVEGAGPYAFNHGMIGYALIRSTADDGIGNCIAYSGTQYRLAFFDTTATAVGYVGSGFYQNTVSGIQINTMLRVPIAKWDS